MAHEYCRSTFEEVFPAQQDMTRQGYHDYKTAIVGASRLQTTCTNISPAWFLTPTTW